MYLNFRPSSMLESAFHLQFYRGELNITVTDLVALKRGEGETIDDYMIRFKNARSRCYVSLPESEVVKIVIMGLGFYERVRQVEIMRKEKEKYKSERKLKSKSYPRKEKVSYVVMESSNEEFDFETGVDLVELKKGPPYVKILNVDKSKKYSFDISKSDQVFDVLLKDKQLIFPKIYPKVGDGMLEFLMQQKLKGQDVSLYPRCNAVFDAEAAAIFEKERKKKELAHKEEQVCRRQPTQRVEGQSSGVPRRNLSAPLSRSQALGVQWIRNCQEFRNNDA
ncbi:hypothetical protein Ahy_A07g033997 [Arachis hypogaea]|uniref:Retrotransposon gag domain-containing protein n=1 Tax=Arachis hypogaea TaxID=3818 RepID=A0A445CAL5_ARAHY|nr:hypothetical protein Ahy_A07g033997 [Arachis hypogaea]